MLDQQKAVKGSKQSSFSSHDWCKHNSSFACLIGPNLTALTAPPPNDCSAFFATQLEKKKKNLLCCLLLPFGDMRYKMLLPNGLFLLLFLKVIGWAEFVTRSKDGGSCSHAGEHRR